MIKKKLWNHRMDIVFQVFIRTENETTLLEWQTKRQIFRLTDLYRSNDKISRLNETFVFVVLIYILVNIRKER